MRLSTIALSNPVVPVGGSTSSYEMSEADGVASLQANYVTGGTITLPGPGSNHSTPNNGDVYIIADPQNVLNGGAKTLTINGGGYDFLVQVGSTPGMHSSVTLGSLLFTGTTESTNAPLKSAIAFTFDANADPPVWIVN